jgi:hypothetical protein
LIVSWNTLSVGGAASAFSPSCLATSSDVPLVVDSFASLVACSSVPFSVGLVVDCEDSERAVVSHGELGMKQRFRID